MNIKKCTCGGSKRPFTTTTPVGFGIFVVCPNCDRFGEMSTYDDEAIYKWNEMIKSDNTKVKRCRCYKFYKGQNSYKYCPDCGRKITL